MSQTPAPDEQTTTSGETGPSAGASLPAFLPPRARPSRPRRPSSPREASSDQGVPTPPPLDDADDDASDWPDESPESSTPASTEDEAPRARFRPIDPNTRKIYAAAVAQGATVASGFVNARMDPDGDAFVMSQDEAEGIAAPASRLLARHVPLSAAAAGQATDLSDIVELIGNLVSYVMASLARRAHGSVSGRAMPDGTEGDYSDLRDDPTPAAPAAPWPMPGGMPPMIGTGA